MKKPIVSIVIPVFNGQKYISDTLESVLSNTDDPYELIVVDDGSEDTSKSLIKRIANKYRQVTLMTHDKNKGTAAALNTGIMKSSSPYVAVLGQDMIVDKHWLSNVISYLNDHPDVGGGQLKILRFGKQYFDSAGELLTSTGFLAERAQGADDNGQFDTCVPIFSGKGTATIFRKSVLTKTGLFDETYRMYWEEPDLFWRIRKAGYRVEFLSMGKTWHKYLTEHKPVTREQQINATYYGCRNQIITILKNGTGFSGFRMSISVILAWIMLSVIFLFSGDSSRSYATIQALGYTIRHIRDIYTARKRVQKTIGKPYFNDTSWVFLVTDTRTLSWYTSKLVAYIQGKPF